MPMSSPLLGQTRGAHKRASAFVIVLALALALSQTLSASLVQALTVDEISQGSVLGDTTYPSVRLTSTTNQSLTVMATPVSFASGQWTYKFDWTRVRNAQGSLYITLKSNKSTKILSIDTAAKTGSKTAVLAPLTSYRFEFYSKVNGDGTVLLRKFFTTMGDPSGTSSSSGSSSGSGSTTKYSMDYILRFCPTSIPECLDRVEKPNNNPSIVTDYSLYCDPTTRDQANSCIYTGIIAGSKGVCDQGTIDQPNSCIKSGITTDPCQRFKSPNPWLYGSSGGVTGVAQVLTCRYMKSPAMAIYSPSAGQALDFRQKITIKWQPISGEDYVDIGIGQYSALTDNSLRMIYGDNFALNANAKMARAEGLSECAKQQVKPGVVLVGGFPHSGLDKIFLQDTCGEAVNDAAPAINIKPTIIAYRVPNTGSYEWQAGTAFGGINNNTAGKYKLGIWPSGVLSDLTRYNGIKEADHIRASKAITSGSFYIKAMAGSNGSGTAVGTSFGDITEISLFNSDGSVNFNNLVELNKNYKLTWKNTNVDQVQVFACNQFQAGVTSGMQFPDATQFCVPLSGVINTSSGSGSSNSSFSFLADSSKLAPFLPGSTLYTQFGNQGTGQSIVISAVDANKRKQLTGPNQVTEVPLWSFIRVQFAAQGSSVYNSASGNPSTGLRSSLTKPFVKVGESFALTWNAASGGNISISVTSEQGDNCSAADKQVNTNSSGGGTATVTIKPCMGEFFASGQQWRHYRYSLLADGRSLGNYVDIFVVPTSKNGNCATSAAAMDICNKLNQERVATNPFQTRIDTITGAGDINLECGLITDYRGAGEMQDRFEVLYGDPTQGACLLHPTK